MTDIDIDVLWREYKASGDVELRNRLMLQYAPLVKYVAGRVRTGLPDTVDPADLVSEGVLGLVEAIERFEPERGRAFQAYAVMRIRGAMIDALRAHAWVPRGVRERTRAVEAAHEALQTRLGRTPTEAEVANELGITAAELTASYGKASYTSVAALDDLVVVDQTPAPGEALEDEAVREMLAGHIRGLRERDQVVLALYYYEGFTLADIGAVLGVGESRASQLHTRSVLALRAAIRATAR